MKLNNIHEVVKDWYFKDVSNKLSSQTSRVIDPIYNDKDAPLQIHTFGDSWTYGEGVEQTDTFTHYLGQVIKVGDEKGDISVWNHGARGVGADYIMKKVSEVYEKYNVDNSIYVITLPHTNRRIWFDDEGEAETKKAWEFEHTVKPKNWKDVLTGKSPGNDYNQYFYFFHQYMLLTRLIGKEKIIWGTWGQHERAESDVPDELVSIKFDCMDYAEDGGHPGVESHMLYAGKIVDVIGRNAKWINK
jgi:diadenosine tetraphosphatase ApaH/serine/threonine PP2A family protein phosphatase|tara:strand:+ start:74 stop:808 length:735 start_codon:yes stop_codon:yes gene_type:complete